MSITSLSFTLVQTYGRAGATPLAAAERPTPAASAAPAAPAAPPEAAERQRAGGQPTRLVQAMMAALREIGLGAVATGSTTATATPATATPPAPETTTTDAPPATGTTSPATAPRDGSAIESAVQQFAHELFQALRGDRGGDESADVDDGGQRAERRHGHGHGLEGRHGLGHAYAYGNLSQRLSDLSRSLAAPTTTAAAPAAVSTELSLSITLDDGTPAPAAATDDTTPSVATVATPTAPVPTPANPATNPLLEAFGRLFAALAPQGSDATAQSGLSDKLRSFLDSLAQSLKPESMAGGLHDCRAGSLVNLTA